MGVRVGRQLASWGPWGDPPSTCKPPRPPHLVLLPAPLLVVVEDVVPKVVLQPVQKPLVTRLLPAPHQEGHQQGEHWGWGVQRRSVWGGGGARRAGRGGDLQARALTEQQDDTGQHDDQGAQADARATRPHRSGPRQAGAVQAAAAHGHVQGLLALLGRLSRVLEQQAQAVQPLLDLEPGPQARVAHCRGCRRSAGAGAAKPLCACASGGSRPRFPTCPVCVITDPCGPEDAAH